MALRFANGARPFIDELFVNQTGSLLFSPFVFLFLKVSGSTEGLVLFCRFLYLALSLVVAFTAYLALSKRLSKDTARLLSVCVALVVPLQIPNLGYNSLGSLF